ncbi:MAG: hypothetical protein IPO31_20990 [Candidatus Obscuribacter sp.]|nr:hypothetical protein [Candidatus Obscuribacter sp.]
MTQPAASGRLAIMVKAKASMHFAKNSKPGRLPGVNVVFCCSPLRRLARDTAQICDVKLI